MLKKSLLIFVLLSMSSGTANAKMCNTDLAGWMKQAFCKQGGDGTGGDGGGDTGNEGGMGGEGGTDGGTGGTGGEGASQ